MHEFVLKNETTREKLINLQILLIFFNKIVILKKGVGVFSL